MRDLPSTTWQSLSERPRAHQRPKGLDAVLERMRGTISNLIPRQHHLLRRAACVLSYEKQLAEQNDARLRETCEELRNRFRQGREEADDLDRGLAVIREVAFRQIGQRPFAVQVAGALALGSGNIVEMATGEGKTLTATMPATIAGWRGRGCHIITVNDYLAQRDAQWMGSIYQFCGLKVAHITQPMLPPDRRHAYEADITYCTNKEVAADFLRDQLVLGHRRGLPQTLLSRIVDESRVADGLVLRGLNHAIVDEADSVLIDEAVTPLIISGEAPNTEQKDAFNQAARIASQLVPPGDYSIHHRYRDIQLTPVGREKLSTLAGKLGGIWQGRRRAEELVTQALVANEYYRPGKEYVVQNEKVVIVDEFTGRLMPDRTWRDGLHQLIEAKENLPVTPVKDTYARISFQRFFRLYRRLSGMTGTAAEASRELWTIYKLPVIVIPSNRPCIRRQSPDRVCATAAAKWQAIVAEVCRIHGSGRPVLIGTRSVGASERLSSLLAERGLDHRVLNAIRHAEEAQIISGAGQAARITVATNMAGRGTDIILGRGVAAAGGLHVIATERHEAGRIDRQLFGRSARQGDPGSAQAFVSLEDELVCRHAPHLAAVLRRQYGQTTKEIPNRFAPRIFDLAQRRAERLTYRRRQSVLQADDWLDEFLGFSGQPT